MSTEKVRLLRALGAEVIGADGGRPTIPEYYINKARAIVASTPAPSWPTSTTTPRIRKPLPDDGAGDLGADEGQVTHFVCSPGTGARFPGPAA